ncbi:hypothetical protein SDC9_200925 [bioreactor metagenome]|uniref:Uncharacterized protein n=1 Tax=bioreactor metagenome TaxID=1076179 RepID=A0A645IPK6_9ZZZZ
MDVTSYGGNEELNSVRRVNRLKRPAEVTLSMDSSFLSGRHCANRWSSDLYLWINWIHPGRTANLVMVDGHTLVLRQTGTATQAAWYLSRDPDKSM